MPPRPVKPSTMPKQKPLRLLTIFLILLALSHLPSLAREHPAKHVASTSRGTILKARGKEKPTYNLEMRWGRHNFDDRICRIHNACLTEKSIAIHPWMKQHVHHLEACGLNNITFIDTDQPPTFQPFDLFGVTPVRFHIPHFLTDVLPMVYSSTILSEKPSPSGDVEAVCETPSRGRCRIRGVTPALLVEERVLKLSPESWVRQLSEVLPGSPNLVAPGKACYRSIVAYKLNYLKHGRRWYSEGELFEKAGVSRASVMGECSPNIVILNRAGWERRGGILLGRDILNVDQVVKAIDERAPKYGLNASVEVAYFENRTFTEQMKIMQRADALLGVHGAGLGNMLFAKMDVPLLEVLPFGYYAGPFDRLARALHLNYSRIIAQPDNESFLDCLKKRADKAGLEQEFKEDADTWKNAVRQWKNSGNEYVLMTHLLTSQRNSSMKICTRGQRLRLDPKKTADNLLNMAAGICKGGRADR